MRAPLLATLALTLSAGVIAPATALAHGGGGAMPQETPLFPPGDGATARAILVELQAKAAADPESGRVSAEALKAVKLALERAHGARAAGDDPHAKMLEGVALEWANTAKDLERAAAAEGAARAASQKAHDVQTKAEHARALLEETQARIGRTAAELARVEADAKDASKGAADAEARRLDAANHKKAVSSGNPRGAPRTPPPPPTKPKKAAK